ncbi:cytidylate kinase [Paenibacillus sp. IHB B 3084]|uniref:(d)CMP kinase n=1 Tax=Paenibacillus sp. IHB B 3084 TaxID=867076 RepID=UPI000722E4B0|nr:(d)CMP kinase [Paenibacillus sp. IHB B 3084]ALP38649.1 cytidylate kinase [Paenibacillus sp. IHB B 3084]
MARQHGSSSNKINVAIDGPAGAGKSTVARLVAKALSYVYVDTGAMYRAATWYMMCKEIPAENVEKVLQYVPELVIELVPDPTGQKVYCNGEDVTTVIRSMEVTGKVSQYSSIAGLRSRLTENQREMAARKGVVMDGRDIGTTVLPDAEVKVFMTASVQERASRRFKELSGADDITLEQLERDIAARDKLDEEREVSPLRCSDDAIVLDTTHMGIHDVVDTIVSYCTTAKDGEIRQ